MYDKSTIIAVDIFIDPRDTHKLNVYLKHFVFELIADAISQKWAI